MPTPLDWANALTTPRLVTIDSSQELLASIRTKQERHNARLLAAGHSSSSPKGPLAVVPQFDPLLRVALTPAFLLHRLGVITTPVIPNLTDISAVWAYIRYLWAFALPTGTQNDVLRLSDAALGIDFHQKALMSDQIGTGMAAVLMERYFDAPSVADVAVVVDDRVLPVELSGVASPDYLFWNAARTAYYVVECKGTRCSKNTALHQLRRGTEQVPSLRFTDGREPPMALVIGTRLTAAGTEVRVLDPPPDEQAPERMARQGSKEGSSRERRISDPGRFQRDIERASALKALRYAGADHIARPIAVKKWPRVADVWPTARKPEIVRANGFGDFFGVQQTQQFRDGLRVEVFQGIRNDVAADYSALDDEYTEVGRSEPVRAIRNVYSQTEGKDGHRVVSLSSDGTILEFRISTM